MIVCKAYKCTATDVVCNRQHWSELDTSSGFKLVSLIRIRVEVRHRIRCFLWLAVRLPQAHLVRER